LGTEFHSVELASWLQGQDISFCVSSKAGHYISGKKTKVSTLEEYFVYPGVQRFYDINLTQKAGFGRFNLAVYWKRKYRGKQEMKLGIC